MFRVRVSGFLVWSRFCGFRGFAFGVSQSGLGVRGFAFAVRVVLGFLGFRDFMVRGFEFVFPVSGFRFRGFVVWRSEFRGLLFQVHGFGFGVRVFA